MSGFVFEKAQIIKEQIKNLADNVDDQVALKSIDLYPKWEEFIGRSLESDVRFQYDGKLWKTIQQINTVLEGQYPSINTAALYTQIYDETGGTLEDPILIEGTGSFTYVIGKYYVYNDVLYLCEREGDSEGTEYSFPYTPDQLVGQYFSVVSEE